MPTTNIPLAYIQKFNALTAANFPSATVPRIDFLDPAQVVSGQQLRPPFAELAEISRDIKPADFERNNFVTVVYELRFWYADEGDLSTAETAIRFNGGTVGQGLGFDYGVLSNLTSPTSTHQILPVSDPRSLGERLDRTGARMHGCALRHKITVLESA